MIADRTDLAVLKPFRIGASEPWRFSAWHGAALVVALIVAVGIGEAQAAAADNARHHRDDPEMDAAARCRASRSTSR